MVAKRFLSPSLRTKVSQADERALADRFVALCVRVGIPAPERELRFAKRAFGREWRFDFAWDGLRGTNAPVALECQGGLFVAGRHSRGPALLNEHEKLNHAALLGWRVLYTTPDKLCDLATLRLIGKALGVTVGEIGAIR